jgi:LPS sulfotransferase NodH
MRRFAGVVDYPLDPEGQLAAIPQMGATPNGVYGLKIFTHQFDFAKSTRWAARLPSLSFVYLERRDLLGQAISHVRALQTQQWISRVAAAVAPTYDQASINGQLVRLASGHARWRNYFARNGLPVLCLTYEAFVQSPQETVEAVGRWIGLSETPRIDISQLGGLEIQRDALSEAWRARFIAETRDLTILH